MRRKIIIIVSSIMIAASFFIFMNTSNRYFNESIAIIQEKVQIMYQTFSLTNQTGENTSFHDGQLVYIFSYEPHESTKQNRLLLQTIEESENQIMSSTLAPIDSQDILSIYWVKEGSNGYYTTTISPWKKQDIYLETLKPILSEQQTPTGNLKFTIPLTQEFERFRHKSLSLLILILFFDSLLITILYLSTTLFIVKPLEIIERKIETIIESDPLSLLKKPLLSQIDVSLSAIESRIQKTEEKARCDALTGLFNRSTLDEQINRFIDSGLRYNNSFSLVFIDFDYFKNINDQHGHLIGDYVLQIFSSILLKEKRTDDCAFRFGGDEFCVLISGDHKTAGQVFAHRIKNSLKNIYPSVNIPPSLLSISIGLADFPYCALDREGLLSAADASLLVAKQLGRGRIIYFRDLFNRHTSTNRQFSNLNFEVLSMLAEAVDARDRYDRNHSQEVAQLSLEFSHHLGLKKSEVITLYQAARLHDLGKVGIDPKILNKPESLTTKERRSIFFHPEIGSKMTRTVDEAKPLSEIILSHHERYDGQGYPHRISKDHIPYLTRILSLCDVYQAMTSPRPYHQAMSSSKAIEEIEKLSGSFFDPDLTSSFVSMVGNR
jgi:diguanylate cyclase (GGDEF)-like protein